MHLFQNLKVSGEGFDKNGFFVADVVRHKMEVCNGQGQVFGERSITVENTQRGAVGAMGWPVMLAIETIGAMAGVVDFDDDTLPREEAARGCAGTCIHVFLDA